MPLIDGRTYLGQRNRKSVQCFGMTDKQVSTRAEILTEAIHYILLSGAVKINHDIPTENNVNGASESEIIYHKI